ncbi:MAG TPA: cupin domain-containing protein [Methylomirabilota bacterium]|jgi:gentisate 1,2-dioxygenase|nr:cupin domain-containing protein [Methylomirabilota bacterium]
MAKTLDELELRQLLHIDGASPPAGSRYAANARYLSSLDGFDIKRPPVPAQVFRAERARALGRDTPTGLIALDLSARLELDFPATTPLILARYARIRSGETLATAFAASAEVYYVIEGSGRTAFGRDGRETLAWEPGDAFVLPGGGAARHTAGPGDAVLWVVTNEPQLAFERCRPPGPDAAPIQAVHYRAAEIRQRLYDVYRDPRGQSMPGKSVNFGNVALEATRTTTPSFTLAMNSLLPGEMQRAHRHNAVAVTLVVAGERCYSMIDGERVDWEPNAVMITPPTRLHSHHNEGPALALFLIVQDGGLYYHCRTMGFSFT